MATELISSEYTVAELISVASGALGSGANEFGENEFWDSDLVDDPVVGSAVVVKLVIFEGRVEVIGGARARPWFRARRLPASG